MYVRLCVRKCIWEEFCNLNVAYRAPPIQKSDFDDTFQSSVSLGSILYLQSENYKSEQIY